MNITEIKNQHSIESFYELDGQYIVQYKKIPNTEHMTYITEISEVEYERLVFEQKLIKLAEVYNKNIGNTDDVAALNNRLHILIENMDKMTLEQLKQIDDLDKKYLKQEIWFDEFIERIKEIHVGG